MDVLVEWCRDWGVKINVQKSGIIHVREKAICCEWRRKSLCINVQVPIGCVVDEHLTLSEMVEDKAATGRKTPGAWLHRYHQEVGDIGVAAFKKLFSSLVSSSMLYGTEIWGCLRSL